MTRTHTGLGAFFAAIALSAIAGSASAQPLPPAAELIAKYQKAIGGKEKLADKNFVTMIGEFSMPAQGMGGAFEAFSGRPNKAALRVTINGFGEVRSGYNGAVAWSMNPMEGPRLIDGPEKLQAIDDADFESMLRNMSSFKSAETVELTKMGTKDCYKVKLVWNSGRETFDCYSPETGLLVGSMATQVSSMGAMESTTMYDEYKDFGGLRMPTRMTIQAMGFDQVLTIKEIKFTEPAATTFELPAEIKALVK